MSKYLMGR